MKKNNYYHDLKLNQVSQASSIMFYAIPVQLSQGQTLNNGKGCIPFEFGCLCVQDSPQDPCPCKHKPPIIIWIPEIKIYSKKKSDRTNYDGRELTLLEVDMDTQVFVEAILPFSLLSLKTMMKKNGTKPYISNNNQTHKGIPKTGHPIVDALIWAGSQGVIAGTVIDSATGASDAIADWLYDTFGPWPY